MSGGRDYEIGNLLASIRGRSGVRHCEGICGKRSEVVRLLSGVHVNINKAPRKFKEITVIDSSVVEARSSDACALALHSHSRNIGLAHSLAL